MSYDIELVDPVTKSVLEVPLHHMTGGTFRLGGSDTAELNITYNYYKHFVKTMGDSGIRTIYGMSAAESIPILENAISQLGDDVCDDYWASTEGNAKSSLCKLLALARLRPDGIWQGD